MKITCDIIRDLLPLYVDDVLSNDSRKLVEEHFTNCKECQEYCNLLKAGAGYTEAACELKQQNVEVELLKNIKSRIKKTNIKISLIVATVAVVICIIIFSLVGFGVGMPVPKEYIQITQLEVDGKTLNVSGYLDGYSKDIKKLEIYQDNGIVYISVIPSLLNIRTQDGFDEEYIAYEEIKGVCVIPDFIWYEGEEITETTAQMFLLENQ